MPKRKFETIEEFKANLHRDGATLFDFNGTKVPCILVNPEKYIETIQRVQGKKLAIDVMLDIFYDGKEVFVDINARFLDTDIDENYLFYANPMLEFFEALASSGMLAFCPTNQNTQNIFMVQLPRREAAERALQIIRSNAKNMADNDR